MARALKYIPNYTLEDYRRWEGDWELWDGIPVSMSPSPFGIHQWAATQIASSINRQLEDLGCDKCFVVMEVDWTVNDRTVVRPDVAVCCDRFPERFIETPPSLIVEVLPESTAQKDRTSKRSLYESELVPNYLMLDTENEQLHFEKLVDGSYVTQSKGEPIRIELHEGCQIEICVPRRK